MVVRVVEFAYGGVQNLKYFCLRINMPKGNHWILRICVVASCQKLGIILLIMLSKISKTKNVLLNWYSKKKKKNSDDFWHRKLTLIVKFWHGLTPPHYTNSQNSVCWSFLILYPLLKNSTTLTAITHIHKNSQALTLTTGQSYVIKSPP